MPICLSKPSTVGQTSSNFRPMGLPAVLVEALDTGLALNREGIETKLDFNVSFDDAQRLYNLVRARQPEVTFELGLAHGISALAIAQALEDNGHGTHYVIDPFENSKYEGIGLTFLERAGLCDRVEFHEAFAEEVIPSLPHASFAFIDSSHLFDLTLMDFILVDKRLDVGGLIGFHDLWLPGLLKVLRYIVTNRHYRVYDDVAAHPLAWKHDDIANQPKPLKWRVRAFSNLVRQIPDAESLFRPEVIALSYDLNLMRYMTLVEKLGEDDRRWDYYRSF